jgi:hypothetical protein
MQLTFERLSRVGAISALAVTATLLLGSVPAAADADREHAQALAAVQKAVRAAPDALGLKVNESVLASMSTAELKAALEIIPNSFELVESPVTKSSGAVSTLAAAATKGCKENTATLYFKGGVTKAKLWRLKSSVDFCWNYGSRTVTSIETATVEAYVYKPAVAMGWKYRGVTNGPTNVARRDTYGISHYETYVQAQFEACSVAGDIACFVESDPWIRLKSYRDGSTNATKGGA